MKRLQGIAASNGIAIAKAYRLEHPDLTVEKQTIENPAEQMNRFQQALAKAKEELEVIQAHALKELGEDKAAIFSAHLLVLSDPELVQAVEQKIEQERVNAEFALHDVASMFIAMFEAMDNEYMKERAADIRDVTKRVLAHLLGVTISNPSMITEEVVIIAEDLTPSDTAQLNRKYVKGFKQTLAVAHRILLLWRARWKFQLSSERKKRQRSFKTAISSLLTGLTGK